MMDWLWLVPVFVSGFVAGLAVSEVIWRIYRDEARKINRDQAQTIDRLLALVRSKEPLP